LARFKALYLRLHNSLRHESNTNSERNPLSKAEAPLIRNRYTEPTH